MTGDLYTAFSLRGGRKAGSRLELLKRKGQKRRQDLALEVESRGEEGAYLWILLYASCSSWQRILGSSTADSRHTFPMVT